MASPACPRQHERVKEAISKRLQQRGRWGYYSMAEVQQHNCASSGWIVVEGKVGSSSARCLCVAQGRLAYAALRHAATLLSLPCHCQRCRSMTSHTTSKHTRAGAAAVQWQHCLPRCAFLVSSLGEWAVSRQQPASSPPTAPAAPQSR